MQLKIRHTNCDEPQEEKWLTLEVLIRKSKIPLNYSDFLLYSLFSFKTKDFIFSSGILFKTSWYHSVLFITKFFNAETVTKNKLNEYK